MLASLVAFLVIIAALGVHVAGAIAGDAGRGDPFLDNAALLVLGVVLGVGAMGGTAAKADIEAQSAHARLDAAGVPAIVPNGTTPPAPHG